MFWNIVRYILRRNNYLPSRLIFYITKQAIDNPPADGGLAAGETLPRLSIPELEKTAATLGELLWVDIAGEEPFMRDDLSNIVSVFCKKNKCKRVTIYTRGDHPEQIHSTAEKILKNARIPLCVVIRLDDIPEHGDKAKKEGVHFEKIQLSYNRLTSLQRDYPSLLLKVQTTISHKNINTLETIITHVQRKMSAVDFHELVFAQSNKDNTEVVRLPHINSLEARKAVILQIWRQYIFKSTQALFYKRLKYAFYSYLLEVILDSIKKERLLFPCYGGVSQGVLDDTGTVRLCELGKPVGNVRDYQWVFPRLWYSYAARNEREKIRQQHCFCYHKNSYIDNILSNPRRYPALFKKLLFP